MTEQQAQQAYCLEFYLYCGLAMEYAGSFVRCLVYRSFAELSKVSIALAEAERLRMAQLARRPFRMFYRLNAECAWQPAWPIGSNYLDAKMELLLAVKTIYGIGSKDIEIVENIGAPQDSIAGDM